MRFVYALFIVLFVTEVVNAQVVVSNLPSLLQYADEHAPLVQQAKLQPSMAKQDVRATASGLYPKINAFGTGDYYPLIPTQVIPAVILGGKEGTYYKAQFGLPYIFTAGAELSMPIINLEKWTQLNKAQAQYAQAEWSSKAAMERAHIQLIQGYYQVLVTREVMKLNDENVQTAEELMRIMDARNKQGVVNPSDYNRTKNLKLDVQSSGFSYAQRIQQSENGLNALLNIDDRTLTFSEVLTSFDWPMPKTEEASQRPGWQEADTKVRVAELALSESRKSGLPRLSLNGRYAYNYQSKFETGSNSVDFSAANIGMRVDVPLFQGNYYRSVQHKSNLQLQMTKLDQEKAHAELAQQQKDWYELYKAAFGKHGVSDEKVKTTADNLRIATLNINEGLIEFDTFNNIFVEYNRARMEQIQNLADGILYYLLSTQKF